MDTLLTKKLEKVYNAFTSKIFEVYNIFKDYYTEERVDLQGYPSYERFYEILKTKTFKEVFTTAKVKIIPDGTLDVIHGGHIAITEATKSLCESSLDNNIWNKIISFFNTPFLLIHFPEVTVTNEYDQHIDIQDLFVKVPLMWDGTMDGNFSLNRATYSKIQYDSDYMHSHVPGINKRNFTTFLSPCLGTGPIRGTSSSLNNEYDEDLWNLFCLELDKYVKTESIEGVPYRRLSQVGATPKWCYRTIYRDLTITGYTREAWVNCFIKYLIESNTLAVFYNSKAYIIAESYEDFCIKTSNAFIHWVNTFDTPFRSLSELLTLEILRESKKEEGKWGQKIMVGTTNQDVVSINAFICMFKGNYIRLNIKNETTQNDESLLAQNKIYTLDAKILSYIMRYLLYTLNLSKTNGYERENSDIAHQNGLYL